MTALYRIRLRNSQGVQRKFADGRKFNINIDSKYINDISDNTNDNISNNNKEKEETNQKIKCRRILEN